MTTPNPTHEPYRGSDVEAWIKRHRDQYSHGDEHWTTLDDLLDTYRDHADTGTPLTEWAPSGPGDYDGEDVGTPAAVERRTRQAAERAALAERHRRERAALEAGGSIDVVRPTPGNPAAQMGDGSW